MELVKTHTFMRKHATGKAKIELRILHVEWGISWEVVKDKWGIWSGPIRKTDEEHLDRKYLHLEIIL